MRLVQPGPFAYSGVVESSGVLAVLEALSKQGRLDTFRQLLAAGETGMTKLELTSRLRTKAGAVTVYLRVLEQAGLVEILPESRVIGFDATHLGGDFRARATPSPMLDALRTLAEEIDSAAATTSRSSSRRNALHEQPLPSS